LSIFSPQTTHYVNVPLKLLTKRYKWPKNLSIRQKCLYKF